jgi:DNA helicase IV
MASLWNDIKKNVGDWATKAADKATEFSRDAADKAEELTKLGKVKLDIFQINREIEKQFTKLGGTVYEKILEQKKNIESDESVINSVEEIRNLEKKLRVKEEEYKKIKEVSKPEPKPAEKPKPKSPKKPHAAKPK